MVARLDAEVEEMAEAITAAAESWRKACVQVQVEEATVRQLVRALARRDALLDRAHIERDLAAAQAALDEARAARRLLAAADSSRHQRLARISADLTEARRSLGRLELALQRRRAAA